MGVLILAAVATGIYFLGKQTTPKPSPNPVITSQTPNSSPSPTDETANWIIYTNNKFNYTFNYPNTQDIKEWDNPVENYSEYLHSTVFYGINGEVDFFIDVWKNSGILIKDKETRNIWCKSMVDRQPKNLLRNSLNCLEVIPIEINGMKAFLSKGAADNSYLDIIDLPHGDYVFELIITTGKNYPQATFSISNQILSTFKFLE
ncbi:MAG: hypothetical protein Q8Q91_02210 [Candidatus Daviesbacteria bacterium]|nr:hypothetical protein [Candidatus Daviesbacteria bacterium]